MSAMVSTELLLKVAQATPEQQAAIARFLTGDSGLHVEAAGARFVFQKSGSQWRVVFEGEDFYMEDTLGARYLDYLLHHPNVAISAFDLEVAVRPEKAKARCRNSMQSETDPVAMRAYLRELTRLRAERDGAAAEARSDEVERIDSDIEQVETAIQSASGGSDSGERARGNVSKAVAAVRKRLAKGSKAEREFAKHLQQLVSTGYECMYSLPGEWRWD
jgi:hypothetical protein